MLFIHRSAGNWLNICFTYTYKINNKFYKKEVSRQYIYWSIKQSPPSERMTKNIIICVTKSKENLHSLKVRKYSNDNNNDDDEKSKPATSVYKFKQIHFLLCGKESKCGVFQKKNRKKADEADTKLHQYLNTTTSIRINQTIYERKSSFTKTLTFRRWRRTFKALWKKNKNILFIKDFAKNKLVSFEKLWDKSPFFSNQRIFLTGFWNASVVKI